MAGSGGVLQRSGLAGPWFRSLLVCEALLLASCVGGDSGGEVVDPGPAFYEPCDIEAVGACSIADASCRRAMTDFLLCLRGDDVELSSDAQLVTKEEFEVRLSDGFAASEEEELDFLAEVYRLFDSHDATGSMVDRYRSELLDDSIVVHNIESDEVVIVTDVDPLDSFRAQARYAFIQIRRARIARQGESLFQQAAGDHEFERAVACLLDLEAIFYRQLFGMALAGQVQVRSRDLYAIGSALFDTAREKMATSEAPMFESTYVASPLFYSILTGWTDFQDEGVHDLYDNIYMSQLGEKGRRWGRRLVQLELDGLVVPDGFEPRFDRPMGSHDAAKLLEKMTGWFRFIEGYGEGWGGDRMVVYESAETGDLAVLWFVLWETDNEQFDALLSADPEGRAWTLLPLIEKEELAVRKLVVIPLLAVSPGVDVDPWLQVHDDLASTLSLEFVSNRQ